MIAKNKRVVIAAALLALTGARAQTFELGKVSKPELEEKQHPKEADAVAAILFEDGTTVMDFSQNTGFSLVTTTDVRIKIYKKEGYDWANKSVEYYVGSNPTEHVEIAKAVTYNLENGAIEKTKLKSEGEFDEKVNKFYMRKKISMPNVREGSIIEYRIVVRSPFLSLVPKWTFQNEIPVNYSHYQTHFPEYYDYKVNVRGALEPKIVRSAETKTVILNGSERTGTLVKGTSFSTDRITYRDNITDYMINDVPAMKQEAYVNNIGNYISSVEHELSVITMPQSQPKYLSTTWEDVVKAIYDNDGFGPELKKTGYFEDDLPAVIYGRSDDAAKTEAVFNFVKQRMNWNNFVGYTCDDGVKKAYKAKVGNAAEINLMLTAMLRGAGVKAFPVLLSTRANGISFFPNRTAYNYVICGAQVNNALVLLDATDKNALPDILPSRALNWFGRIIREDGSSDQIDLAPKKLSKDAVFIIADIDPSGKMTGKLREQYFDYNAFHYRQQFGSLSQDSYLESMEKRYPGLEVSDFSAVRDDFSKPVVENYAFTHTNTAETIDDKMYISAMTFLAVTENPFKQEKREYPVDFGFPSEDRYSITINIPDGYAVESLPAPAAVAMPDGAGKFSFNITSSGKSIQMQCVSDINKAIFSPDEYSMLKDYYKLLIEKENEKIVLKKI